MKQFLLVAAVCALFSPLCFSQPQQIYQTPNILPPSPTAAELGKYGLVPLNLATGTPNIEIPLAAFKTKNLELPISLSYHSSGVRVDDIAPWTGMGWSLNSGGAITRVIRDEPDEYGMSIGLPYPDEFGVNYQTLKYIEVAGNNDGMDLEPDLYAFNFGSYTGKFVIDRNGTAMIMPYSNIIIQKIGGYFVITTPDGVKYTFDETELSSTYGTPSQNHKAYDPYPTTWYLTKVEHPLGDVIELTYGYNDYNYVYSVSNSQTFTRILSVAACGTCPSVPEVTQPLAMMIYGKHLSKISSANYGSIEFSATKDRSDLDDYKLNSFTIKNSDNQVIKSVSLNYAFTPGRMFLTKLIEKDQNGLGLKIHDFEYEDMNGLPARLSFSQDHWGYFNGAGNTHFVPKNLMTRDYLGNFAFVGIGGDRQPNPQYSKKGTLKKITYPTGGYSQFTFEGNTIYGSKIIYPQKTQEQLSCNGIENSSGATTKWIEITSPSNQTIEFTFSASLYPGQTDSGIGAQLNITNVTAGTFLRGYSLNLGQHKNDYFDLYAGVTYRFTIIAAGPPVSGYLYFDYYKTTPQTIQANIDVGGVRIAKAVNHDPFTKKDEEINYFYAKHNQLSVSSGRTVTIEPLYFTEYFNQLPCGRCTYGALHSDNKRNLFKVNGADVFYQYVTIQRGNDTGAGVEEHEFEINFDTQAQLVWGNRRVLDNPLTNSGWNHGLEKFVRYYKVNGSQYTLVKEQSKFYTQDSRKFREVPSLIVRKIFQPTNTQNAIFECNSSNINAVSYEFKCQTNHNHALRSNFPWEDQHWYCYAPGHDNQYVAVAYHPCYGHQPGETVLAPYNLDYLDAVEYKNMSFWVYENKLVETTYDENGLNPVTKETSYVYDNPVHAEVSRVITKGSQETVSEVYTTYPEDYTNTGNDLLLALRNQHISNIPVKRENIVNNKLVSGEVIMYNAKGQPKQAYKYESATLKAPPAVNPLLIIPSSDFKLHALLDYDADNNLTKVKVANNTNTAYLWGYNNTLPVGQIKKTEDGVQTSFTIPNTYSNDIRISRFEGTLSSIFEISSNQNISPTLTVGVLGTNPPASPSLNIILKKLDGTVMKNHACTWNANSIGTIALVPGVYQWVYTSNILPNATGNGYHVDMSFSYTAPREDHKVFYTSFEDNGVLNATPRTGLKVWPGAYTFNLPGYNGNYKLTYWKKTGAAPWALIEQPVTVSTGTVQPLTIGDASSIIDEVRLHPVGALMTTFTHIPMVGVSSANDPNNVMTFYKYDSAGRLEFVKDSEENIVKDYKYHYKNQQ